MDFKLFTIKKKSIFLNKLKKIIFMKKSFLDIITISLVVVTSCNQAPKSASSDSTTKNNTESKAVLASNVTNGFNAYWFAGKAEINSYDYFINRYDQPRKGYAVMIFVTEDFSKSKHVKLDYPERAGDDRVPVLKINALQRFNTGIYDYSMMSSIFTPIDLSKNPRTLKMTTTVQDWCGHVFTQLDENKDKYRISQYSYFEAEGDKQSDTEGTLLEDEILTRLRLNPSNVPTGDVKLIPNLTYTRLRHKPIEPMSAKIEIKDISQKHRSVVVKYTSGRRLEVDFEAAFPHKIMRIGEYDGDKKMSEAILKKSIMSDYWAKNGNEYANLRADLGI
jgi:hypothetical protein